MERYCSTGQRPQRAVAPMEEDDDWGERSILDGKNTWRRA